MVITPLSVFREEDAEKLGEPRAITEVIPSFSEYQIYTNLSRVPFQFTAGALKICKIKMKIRIMIQNSSCVMLKSPIEASSEALGKFASVVLRFAKPLDFVSG